MVTLVVRKIFHLRKISYYLASLGNTLFYATISEKSFQLRLRKNIVRKTMKFWFLCNLLSKQGIWILTRS